MQIGDEIEFYLFGNLTKGEIYEIDTKERTIGILENGYKHPNVRTFKKLPKKKKDIPPWYIIK